LLFSLCQISKDTKHILLEVTSSVSLDTCKKVMDELVRMSLELGMGRSSGAGAAGDEDKEADDDDEGNIFSSSFYVFLDDDEGKVISHLFLSVQLNLS
jgi:hypothetical protein